MYVSVTEGRRCAANVSQSPAWQVRWRWTVVWSYRLLLVWQSHTSRGPAFIPWQVLNTSGVRVGHHHYHCWHAASNVDISLQSGRFWATSVASFRESYWISVFIHVVQGRPGGLLQFSKEEAVKIFLASVSSGSLVKQGETLCLDNSWKVWIVAWLSILVHHSTHGGTIWFLTAFTDTIDWEHQSWVHLSWWLPSTQSHTDRQMGRMEVL